MSAIPAIDPATADGSVKPTLDAVQHALGIVPNLHRVVANSPAALGFYSRGEAALSRSSLTAAQREAVALAVAQIDGCDYCLSAHTVLGKGAGLGQDDIDRARQGHAGDTKTDAILVLAAHITRERGHIGPDALATAKTAGVTDAEILEIIALIAVNVFTNYVNVVAGTEIDFPVVRA